MSLARGKRLERHTPLSRGKPMERGEGLKRSGPMKRSWMKKQSPRRVAARKALRPYLGLIAKMPCAGELGVKTSTRTWRDRRCSGPIQVCHLGPKPGMGMKCPDDETGPMCLLLHTDFDQHKGVFAGWSRSERREWADGIIAACQLAAIPTTRDEAIDLQNLGLGAILQQVHGTGWAWHPTVNVGATESTP